MFVPAVPPGMRCLQLLGWAEAELSTGQASTCSGRRTAPGPQELSRQKLQRGQAGSCRLLGAEFWAPAPPRQRYQTAVPADTIPRKGRAEFQAAARARAQLCQKALEKHHRASGTPPAGSRAWAGTEPPVGQAQSPPQQLLPGASSWHVAASRALGQRGRKEAAGGTRTFLGAPNSPFRLPGQRSLLLLQSAKRLFPRHMPEQPSQRQARQSRGAGSSRLRGQEPPADTEALPPV